MEVAILCLSALTSVLAVFQRYEQRRLTLAQLEAQEREREANRAERAELLKMVTAQYAPAVQFTPFPPVREDSTEYLYSDDGLTFVPLRNQETE